MKTPTVPSNYDNDTLRDIYLRGYSRGFNVASWNDIPEIGSTLSREVNWAGLDEISDANEQAEALGMIASHAESQDRDFSPFEFTAHEFNEREDSEDVWEAFESGISDGISANVRSRIAL
jgi:hypothetical protein